MSTHRPNQTVQAGSTLADPPEGGPARAPASAAKQGTPSEAALLLARGLAEHKKGNAAFAEGLYREVLREQPKNPDALHLLGVLAHQGGNAARAAELISQAVAINGQVPFYHHNLGNACRSLGRLEQAALCFRQAIALAEYNRDALLNLGAVCQQLGSLDEAVRSFRQILARNPADAEACLNMGICLLNKRASSEALHYFDMAIKADSGLVAAHNGRGQALVDLKRLTEAEAAYRKCLGIDPNYVAAHNNLGRILQDQSRMEDASAAYAKALELMPTHYEVLVNMGALASARGDFEHAIAVCKKAQSVRPKGHEAWTNCGLAQKQLGQFEDARRSFEQALTLCPTDPEATVSRGLLLLQLGELAQGWDDYEARFRAKDAGRPRRFTKPAWQGESLSGRTILIHAEQGIGDEIMFASCLPDVIAKAGRVLVTCDARLQTLFARSFPAASMIGVERGQEDFTQLDRLDCDLQLAAGSLPRLLRRSEADFPRQQRYLLPDTNRVALYKERFARLGPGLKVGISWRGGNNARDRALRSTSLESWRQLLRLPGAQFISLQYDHAADEVTAANKSQAVSIIQWKDIDPMTDQDGFAALLCGLDLVISVGNATVHLAGALGVPTWCLLPCDWGWRWFSKTQHTPWYRSVELFRQPAKDQWQSVFEQITTRLEHRLGTAPPPAAVAPTPAVRSGASRILEGMQ